MRRRTDPGKLGINVRKFTDTAADRKAAQEYCRSMATKFNRSTVTVSEWLFIEAACKSRPHGRYLEIGVYRHTSTCAFWRAMEGSFNTASLVTVDVEYRHSTLRSPCWHVNARWVRIEASSVDVLPELWAAEYDVILIDGSHDADIIRHDIKQSLRLVAPGGVILIHDANSPPLMTAILESIHPHQLDFMRCHPDHTKGLAVYPKGWPDND